MTKTTQASNLLLGNNAVTKNIRLSFYQISKDGSTMFERYFEVETESDLNIKKAIHAICGKIEAFAFDILLIKQEHKTFNLGFKLSKPLFIKASIDNKPVIDTIQGEFLKIAVRAKSGDKMFTAKFLERLTLTIVKNIQETITPEQITDQTTQTQS